MLSFRQKTFDDEHDEAEKEGQVWRRYSVQSSTVNIRPPSRACNPLVHDEEFLRMNKGPISKIARNNGSAMVHKIGMNQIELTEHA